MNYILIRKIVPGIVLCFLLVMAAFAPAESIAQEWIPLIGGLDMPVIMTNTFVSVTVTFVFVGIILLSVYGLFYKTNAFSFNHTVLLFLLLMMANPYSIYFSSIYPALLCLIWMQYFFIERQFFTAFFLLSLSSLFYAPLIWCIPIALILSLSRTPDAPRLLVKALSATAIPPGYLLIFRWLKFNDANEFLLQYLNEITTLNFPFNSLHLSNYALIVCLFFIVFHAFRYIFSKLPNGIAGSILQIESVVFVLSAILFFCFCQPKNTPIFVLVALPASILCSWHFDNNIQKYSVRVEFIFIMCLLVINRLAGFIY